MSRAQNHFVRVESAPGALVLRVATERLRDVAAVARFERELRALPRQHAEGHWVLDFGGATFFLTPAANALLAVMRALRQRGGELTLAGVNGDVRYILSLLRLDQIFAIYDTRAEALAALTRTQRATAAG